MDWASILATTVNACITFLTVMLLGRVLLSWFPEPQAQSFWRSLRDAFLRVACVFTEPLMGPIRTIFHKSPLGGPGMPLDFSPLITVLLLQVVGDALLHLIHLLL